MNISGVGEMGVGETGVGEMGQIIGETGVGEMGVGKTGTSLNEYGNKTFPSQRCEIPHIYNYTLHKLSNTNPTSPGGGGGCCYIVVQDRELSCKILYL